MTAFTFKKRYRGGKSFYINCLSKGRFTFTFFGKFCYKTEKVLLKRIHIPNFYRNTQPADTGKNKLEFPFFFSGENPNRCQFHY